MLLLGFAGLGYVVYLQAKRSNFSPFNRMLPRGARVLSAAENVAKQCAACREAICDGVVAKQKGEEIAPPAPLRSAAEWFHLSQACWPVAST
jgi:hypothetical protein